MYKNGFGVKYPTKVNMPKTQPTNQPTNQMNHSLCSAYVRTEEHISFTSSVERGIFLERT